MNIKEIIKKKILEVYNKNNENNPQKLDIEKINKIDPFYNEFQEEILKSIKSKNSEIETKDDLLKKEEALPIETLYSEDEEIDNNLLIEIEKKILNFLSNLKLEYYKNAKDDLKNIFIKEILDSYQSLNLKENIIKKISIYIDDLVDHEFKEFHSKKGYLKKELLKGKLQKILPDVNGFFDKNNGKKLIQMTIFQRNNLIKYFIETLYGNYVQNDFIENIINEEEFIFLKDKIKEFVINRYEKILSEEL